MASEVVVAKPEEKKNIKFRDALEEIQAYIKGRVPIIWVQTHEESRFVEIFDKHIAHPNERDVWLWSSYQGLLKLEDALANPGMVATGEEAGTNLAPKALARITAIPKSKNAKGQCFIMRDLHTVLDPNLTRQFRDMYEYLMQNRKTLIITSPVLAHGPGGNSTGLPITLEKQVAVVRFELPTAEQINNHIIELLNSIKAKSANVGNKANKSRLDYTDEEIQSFTRALQGLTMTEIDDAISASMTHLHEMNVRKLIANKKQILRKSDTLEYVESDLSMEDVGGLDLVKDYLAKYSRAHSDEAKKFGVEPLKGILFVGIAGCGKSLLAKTISSLWKLPLVRFDVGKVMGSLVGQSEGKMRDAIATIEALSPAILWCDEIEKALGGTKSSAFSDGGTLSRVFGTLLTAMQEGMQGITLIATANDISLLPPEFIRRFNEVFFVDLPGPEERWDIFGIHLEKRGRKIAAFEKSKEALIKASDGYTGAEIEKAIKDGIAAAFYAEKKDVTGKELLEAIINTKPISKVMGDKITKMREKAKGTYRYASSYAEAQSGKQIVKTSAGKPLDLNSSLDDMDELTRTPKEKVVDNKEESKDRFIEE